MPLTKINGVIQVFITTIHFYTTNVIIIISPGKNSNTIQLQLLFL